MDDQDVQKIIIVTQTPPAAPAAYRKHPGGDRTGVSYNRSKITADIAHAINDGLYFYEQVSKREGEILIGEGEREQRTVMNSPIGPCC